MPALLFNRWVQLAAIGLLAAFFFWRWSAGKEEIGKLKDMLVTQVAETNRAADANATNQVTITDLQGRLTALVMERASEATERERIMGERDAALAQIRRNADKARRERDALFRSTQGCQELAKVRVDLACPAIAERLRQRSAGPGSH